MEPASFVFRFIRDAQAIGPDEYRAFFADVLWRADRRDVLLAWLAAASARPFSAHVAECLVDALMAGQSMVELPQARTAVNIVGTGGGPSTFNISTAAAFVAAAAGARVLKSGSPAYGSQSGSADVLQALGVVFDAGEEDVAHSLSRFGLAFAPMSAYPAVLRRMALNLHPMPLKAVGGIVNRIGPLLCPYRVHAQLTGVPHSALLQPYAELLKSRGPRRAWVVCAEAGIDELCSLSLNHVVDVHVPGASMRLDPQRFDCVASDVGALAGGPPAEAARIVESILAGVGARVHEDTVLLNASAVLCLGGVETDMLAAFARCRSAVRRGEAHRLLQGLREHARLQRGVRSAAL